VTDEMLFAAPHRIAMAAADILDGLNPTADEFEYIINQFLVEISSAAFIKGLSDNPRKRKAFRIPVNGSPAAR